MRPVPLDRSPNALTIPGWTSVSLVLRSPRRSLRGSSTRRPSRRDADVSPFTRSLRPVVPLRSTAGRLMSSTTATPVLVARSDFGASDASRTTRSLPPLELLLSLTGRLTSSTTEMPVLGRSMSLARSFARSTTFVLEALPFRSERLSFLLCCPRWTTSTIPSEVLLAFDPSGGRDGAAEF